MVVRRDRPRPAHRRDRARRRARQLVARALVKHLDGLTADEVVELNLPTGEPLVYELNDDLRPTQRKGPGGVKGRFLDPKRALAAAAAVAKQAG